MSFFTILKRNINQEQFEVRALPQRFNIWAFFFPIFWTLLNGLWLQHLLLVLFYLIIIAMYQDRFIGLEQIIFIQVTTSILAGLQAAHWKKISLIKRGYTEVGLILANDMQSAERNWHKLVAV